MSLPDSRLHSEYFRRFLRQVQLLQIKLKGLSLTVYDFRAHKYQFGFIIYYFGLLIFCWLVSFLKSCCLKCKNPEDRTSKISLLLRLSCLCVFVGDVFIGDSDKPSGFRSVKAPSTKIGSSVGNTEKLPICDKCESGIV